LNGLQEKIFIDRYALKNPDASAVKAGDTVMITIAEGAHAHTQDKAVATVESVDGIDVTVKLRDGSTLIIEKTALSIAIETEPAQLWDRLATAISNVERTDEKRAEWRTKFRALLDDWKLVPGGRIAAGAGADTEQTLFNCYVIPSPNDSRDGIMRTLTEMTEIMSRGGGVGINLSSLRPKRAIVRGVNGTSSGSVSWGGIYSYATGLIEQGGSRRGALMLMLHDWHPDVIDFITVKQRSGAITNANLSVCVSDSFMTAVKDDADWTFKFPDTTAEVYDTEWNGDIAKWEHAGNPVITYSTVKAREVWALITESAWKSAEPGVVFMERYNNVSNSWYFNPIICTNPCGEQGLPAWGVCNLSAINLSKFVTETGRIGFDSVYGVDWIGLRETVHMSVRFLDNVIDATPYHFAENRANQENERRVGLGTMGLAEMLIRLGIRYGSAESLTFIDELYEFIAVESYKASIDIAAEKGAFPAWDRVWHRFNDSAAAPTFAGDIYANKLDDVYARKYDEYGIRNVTLLTQAPTGSTGTMVDTSTGIEPYFAFEFTRQSRLGTDKQYVKVAQDWIIAHPGESLPDYFVSSMALSAEDHVRVQAVIQRWVDSSISKTANAPSEFTVEDTRKLYELAYELGCKGVTIYRDGCRDVQVLSVDKPEDKALVTEAPAQLAIAPFSKRPTVLNGKTIKTPTPFGKAYVTINENERGDIEEIFVKLGKTGADIGVIADGLAIALTGALSPRIASLTPAERVAWITKKFRGMSGATTVGFGPNRVESLPDALAKVITQYIGIATTVGLDAEPHGATAEEYDTVPSVQAIVNKSADLCTQCGGATLIREEGCYNCVNCGYSKCG
jgi:ribonucleoside-diphosphate reductase alpha chain